MYYDKAGNPITFEEWITLYEKGFAYKRIAEDTVTTSSGSFWISTVWLGFNHNFGTGPPLIFETMVFPVNGDIIDFGEKECVRYTSEPEAQQGHRAIVLRYTE